MDALDGLKDCMARERPAPWETLPDINLYMDQVLAYLPRQLMAFDQDGRLTSAMVNNYSKEGLLPRAEGKRYTRTHLAYLTAISALKQVLSVRETKALLSAAGEGKDAEAFYVSFCRVLDEALTDTADKLSRQNGADRDALTSLALSLALHSYAAKLACQHLLTLLQPPESPRRKGGK